MRKPREHGWTNPDGITHHINTRKTDAWQRDFRQGSCWVPLRYAVRTRFEHVDCMMCIAIVVGRERYPPRPPPRLGVLSWRVLDGTRHQAVIDRFWRARCGVSIRHATASNNPVNCVKCERSADDKSSR